MSKLNNTTLRADLLNVYEELRNKSIDPKLAKELNNTAGKVMNSVKIQVEYATLRDEKPDIDFLNVQAGSRKNKP